MMEGILIVGAVCAFWLILGAAERFGEWLEDHFPS